MTPRVFIILSSVASWVCGGARGVWSGVHMLAQHVARAKKLCASGACAQSRARKKNLRTHRPSGPRPRMPEKSACRRARIRGGGAARRRFAGAEGAQALGRRLHITPRASPGRMRSTIVVFSTRSTKRTNEATSAQRRDTTILIWIHSIQRADHFAKKRRRFHRLTTRHRRNI